MKKQMRERLEMKIKWATDQIEILQDEFKMDGKEKHLRKTHELKGQIEACEDLLRIL